MRKRTTFTDFVACAEHLVATGVTTPAGLAARGGSAGGLLMGRSRTWRPTCSPPSSPRCPSSTS